MPAIATLDTIAGSSIRLEGQSGGRIVRTGLVEGLPVTGVDPSEVLFHAETATGMPVRGSAHPTRPNFILSSIGVLGQSADTARVELIYEPFGSNSGISYVIEISSGACTYETNLLPGTKMPFLVGFTPSDLTKYQAIPSGYVSMTMLRPIVRVIVTQLRTGSLGVTEAAAFASNVGKVNNAPWMNYPAGSWLTTHAVALASKYDSKYQTRLEATRQGEDRWIYFGILQDQATGKIAYEPTKTEAEINSIKNLPYSYGVSVGNGVVRCDPYLATDFTTLFGF